MNDRGKLNLSVILVGLIAIVIISFGAFSITSRASDNANPKAPSILQADKGSGGDNPPSDKGDQSSDEEKKDESGKKSDENAEKKTEKKTEEQGKEEKKEGEEKKGPPHDDSKTHKEQTPKELKDLGISFKDEEGSPVSERTKKILEVNLAQAMQRKNDAARSFLTVNAEGRVDPLYITDAIPDALRPELEGEGISGAIDKGLIDQLIQSQLSTIFKYMPVEIIGTMQNGPYKSVLLTIPGFYYGILIEGQAFSIPAFPSEKGIYYINMSVVQISEDEVTMAFSATMVDRLYGRVLASTPPVYRHFYVKRYQ